MPDPQVNNLQQPSTDDNSSSTATSGLINQGKLSPWGILKAAYAKYYPLKYVYGFLGIISAVVIVRGFGLPFFYAIAASAALIVLMVTLLVLEVLTEDRNNNVHVKIFGNVMVWIVLLLFVSFAFVSAYWIFYGIPPHIKELLGIVAVPEKTWTIRLVEDGLGVNVKFTVTFSHGIERKNAFGSNGEATITLKPSPTTIENIVLDSLCYSLNETTPIQLIDGNSIDINVHHTVSRSMDPLFPEKYPNPNVIIPKNQKPSKAEIEMALPHLPSQSYELRYTNTTDKRLRLLLFNYAQSQQSDESNPWRELPADPCDGTNHFSGFNENSGLFAVIAHFEDNNPAVFLGNVNVFHKQLTTMSISNERGRYVVDIQQ